MAKQLDYRPNAFARAMRTKKNWQIGLLLHDFGNERFAPMYAFETITGIMSILESKGYVVSLVRATDVEAQSAIANRVFREHILDGIIVLAALLENGRRYVEDAHPELIWCDAGVHRDTNCIYRDEEKAGKIVGQQLLALGYKKWLIISDKSDPRRAYTQTAERLQGVLQMAQRIEIQTAVVPADYHELPEDLLKDLTRETAVIALNYHHPYQVVHSANQHGLIAGRDFGLVCCDDYYDFSRNWPQLARTTYDRHQLGRDAAEMFLDLMDEKPVPSRIDQPVWNPGSTLPDVSTP